MCPWPQLLFQAVLCPEGARTCSQSLHLMGCALDKWGGQLGRAQTLCVAPRGWMCPFSWCLAQQPSCSCTWGHSEPQHPLHSCPGCGTLTHLSNPEVSSCFSHCCSSLGVSQLPDSPCEHLQGVEPGLLGCAGAGKQLRLPSGVRDAGAHCV